MKKPAILHEHFCDAEVQLRRALANHRPGRLIGICGLAGAGKTFLRNRLIREIVGPPEAWGTGKLAVVEAMALLDANAKFSAKGFAMRSHRALMRPDFRGLYRDTDDEIQRAYLDSLRRAERAWPATRGLRGSTETDYWLGFTESAIDRELKYFLVEHATALGTLKTGEVPADHIQNLMSLMEAAGAMGVLNLVPEGYKLWEGRPEISDRMDMVYIAPYDIRIESQATEFARLVLAIAEQHDVKAEAAIQELITQIAIATATSIRPIEEMLERAKSLCIQDGRACITADDLLSAMPTMDHVKALWERVRILKRISAPADKDELLTVYQEFVESSS